MIHFLYRTKAVAAALVRNLFTARESADEASRQALERLREAHSTPEAQARHKAANEEFVRQLRKAGDQSK